MYEEANHIAETYGFEIRNVNQRLSLCVKGFLPLFIDFNTLPKNRLTKNQGLIKACKPKEDLLILDGMAGWGRDGCILAYFGAKILMLEKNPIMALLLSDAIKRTNLPIRFIYMDVFDYLHTLKERTAQVIYLDPMHPTRQKSAKVSAEMQILQRLIPPNNKKELTELIELSLTKTLDKVVVKWPQKTKPLLSPTYQIKGNTIRFDIYKSNK